MKKAIGTPKGPANRALLVTSYNNHKMGILSGSMRKKKR